MTDAPRRNLRRGVNNAKRELRCRRHLRRRDVTNAQHRIVTNADRVTNARCVNNTPTVTYDCCVTNAGREQRPERDQRTRCETSDMPNGPTCLIRVLLLE